MQCRVFWCAGLGLAMAAGAGQPVAARTLYAGPYWAALERSGGKVCAAVARSELLAPEGREQARASISFDRIGTGRRQGELHVRLSRPARPATEALLLVGGRSFQLLTRGADAWSRGPAQEAAIIAAMRRAGDMRIRFRGAASGYTDRYLLAGAPTAIDAAAIACSRAR